MKYKLICIDLDGTLLDDKKRISEENIAAIRRASAQGVKIAIITGRMPGATEFIAKQLQVPCILVCNAGTCIVEDKKCKSVEYMSADTMKNIYEIIKKFNVPLWIFRERQWFVTEMDSYIQEEIDRVYCTPEIADVETLARGWKRENTGPNKVLVSAEPEIIQAIYEELRKEQIQDVDMACSADIFLEIFPKGINKGKALKIICDEMGISREEVIAFGDQELDISMLEAAGMGVAMGNAIDELKEKADFVTKTNNEAGIAYALEHIK